MGQIKKNLACMQSFLVKPIVYSIFMGLFSYITVMKFTGLPKYQVLSLFVFGLLVYFYQKTNFRDKLYIKDGLILSSIFSLLLILGRIILSGLTNPQVNFLTEFLHPKTLVYFLGLCFLFLGFFMHLLPKAYTIHMKEENTFSKKKIRRVFLFSFLLLIVGWLPYFLTYYPGNLSPDSLSQFQTIMNHFSSVSDHHPVLHTVFMSIPYSIGMALFHSKTDAAGFVAIVQMIVFSSIFSYMITFIYKRVRLKIVPYGIALILALSPIFGYYSTTMWKDVLFSAFMVLLTIQTIILVERKEKITLKSMIPFTIISFLTLFFRNNAIYMYLLYAGFGLIFFRKQWKTILPIFLVIIGTYFIVKGPVFQLLKIQKTSSAEYIAIPLQQMGRIAYKDGVITKEQKKLLKPLIPVEKLKELYDPIIVDAIKFNKAYHREVFDKNKGTYFKLWAELVIQNPAISVEAYFSSTLGYWYPNVEYWSVQKGVVDESYGIKNAPKTFPLMKKYVDTIDQRWIPLVGMQWSIGLCVWILFTLGYITVRRGKWKNIYPFIPVFGIWLTMMIAAPVNAEFRYMFAAFACAPILFVYALTTEKESQNKKDKRRREV